MIKNGIKFDNGCANQVKGEIMKKLNLLMTALLMFALMSLFTNCEPQTETVTETDTLYVPVADSFYVDIAVADSGENTVAIGGQLTLTATVRSGEALTGVQKFWNVDGGKLSAETGDTVVWTAPETEGTYTVTVHASNDEKATVSTMNLGSGAYVAVADTYYVGEAVCAACHSDKATAWSGTAHAGAWATLQANSHAGASCIPCHTVDSQQTPGNGGYDDTPVSAMVNVQCENCHGAGSAHRATVNPDAINIDLHAENCGVCHSGSHHPFYDEWATSGHNYDASGHTNSATCAPCHTGTGFIERMDAASGIVYDSNDPVNIACAVCHDPHSADNYMQLRGLDVPVTSVVANGAADEIQVTGAGQVCAQCHHARSSADTQVDAGSSRMGPHHSNQSDMLAGISGYEFDGSFDFGGYKTGHYKIENSCATCHVEGTTGMGHTFMPTTGACAKCHGEIEDFSDIKASGDFDGNGTVEGLQTEVEGLMDILTADLVAAGLDTTGGVTAGLNATRNDTLSDGSPDPTAVKLRKAGYNIIYILEDRSMGVHNPVYTVELLQQSIAFLNAKSLAGATIITSGDKATDF